VRWLCVPPDDGSITTESGTKSGSLSLSSSSTSSTTGKGKKSTGTTVSIVESTISSFHLDPPLYIHPTPLYHFFGDYHACESSLMPLLEKLSVAMRKSQSVIVMIALPGLREKNQPQQTDNSVQDVEPKKTKRKKQKQEQVSGTLSKQELIETEPLRFDESSVHPYQLLYRYGPALAQLSRDYALESDSSSPIRPLEVVLVPAGALHAIEIVPSDSSSLHHSFASDQSSRWGCEGALFLFHPNAQQFIVRKKVPYGQSSKQTELSEFETAAGVECEGRLKCDEIVIHVPYGDQYVIDHASYGTSSSRERSSALPPALVVRAVAAAMLPRSLHLGQEWSLNV